MTRIFSRLLLVLGLILFFVSPPNLVLAADSCGQWQTNGKCGEWGGCEVESKCEVTYGWLWTVADTACTPTSECDNVNQSIKPCGERQTRNNCGPINGCDYGYMCSEVSSGQWACVTPTDPNAVDCSVPPPITDPKATNSQATGSLTCGQTTTNQARRCECDGAPSGTQVSQLARYSNLYCCGWAYDNTSCYASQAEYDQADIKSGGAGGGTGGGSSTEPEPTPTPPNIFEGPTNANFDSLNPLKNFSDGSAGLTSPGAIVSRLLQFAFPLAGLILFAELVWGGFEMLIGATGKGIEAGKQRVTNALVGFMLLFVAYWIFQIVEVIFGVTIL